MATPIWITPAGNLGKIQEAEFYDFQLLAYDPDSTDESSLTPGILFTLQSGKLPSGLRLTREGKCEGNPSCEVYVSGVPTNVGQDVTSRFVIRATSLLTGVVNDRTFELTVVGQDDPIILTESGLLGTYRDGDYVSLQILASDPDPDDELSFRVLNGTLPLGLELSTTGIISGYIRPVPTLTGTPGFDTTNVGFDINSFDFRTIAENKNYQFTVVVTDGKSYVAKKYTIFVYSGDTFRADTTELTADMTGHPLTADMRPLRTPALLTTAGSLGLVTHDNYFAYKFDGIDFDGDTLEYTIGVGSSEGYDNDNGYDTEVNGFDMGNLSLPPGLTLNSTTGWLYGYIPNQLATQTEYTFTIRVQKADDNTYRSEWKFFTITIVGDVRKVITWITDSDLGTIRVGEISTLQIETTNTLNKSVQYRLKSGSNSSLPQGLRLNPDGLIVGRPHFKTFMLDGGSTTFDKDHRIINETTFEKKFTFTVQIYDADGDINTTKAFTITLDPGKFKPYENLWVKAYPKVSQREMWNSLINSLDDFPPEKIYRKTDYWFGKQNNLRAILTAGLNPKQTHEYISSMSTNHYNKKILIGDIKKARAIKNNEVIYEVVYAEIIDREESNSKSVSSSVNFINKHGLTWSNPIYSNDTNITADTDVFTSDQRDQHIFYPNSFKNMNSKIVNSIGQLEYQALPLWMRSKQESGKILGFIPCVIIAYVTPGNADQIIFNINRRTDVDLKKIEFVIDRYIYDFDMSVNYDKTYAIGDGSTISTPRWNVSNETTFDLEDGFDDQTVFDVDSTTFIEGAFQYKSFQDEGDMYLKFPQMGIKK